MTRGARPRPALHLAVIGLRGVPNVIGGIETHCGLLYPALVRQLPDLAITLLVRRRYVRKARYEYEGVAVQALRSPRGTASETLIHSLWALVYARFRLKASIVHLHGIGPGFYAPLARLLGMQVVVTDHAADFLRPKWGRLGRAFLRLGETLSARHAQRVVCVSEALRDDLLTRHPAAAHSAVTIRHGVALQITNPAGDARMLASMALVPGEYFLAVTRIDSTKRIEDLIAAHATLPAGRMPLVIAGSSVGDDSYERQLHRLAGPDVLFVGFCSGARLTALYRGAALFLHASEMEGFGLVVLEALSVGARVAVSDIPVHREFRLPEPALFPLGDVAAIGRIMAAATPRVAPWPAAATIAARHSGAASSLAHAELFRGLAPALTLLDHVPVDRASMVSNKRQ